MRNIKLTVAYDGSDFQGWQVQKDGRTVQDEIESGLSRMEKRAIKVNCAGRTDSGVHANGQVINFQSRLDHISLQKYPQAVSSFFPRDISAIRAEVVSEDFHARHWAKRRSYKYYILSSQVRIPQYRRYSWRLIRKPDVNALNAMAAVFLGEHDFSSFSAPNEQVKNRVRRVFSASFYPEGDFIVFRITGNAFLWKMVRSMVGSLVEYEEKGIFPDQVREYLLSRDRSLAGATAPAKGLFFDKVEYCDQVGGY